MPMAEGWNRPTYDVLADAGTCTAAVMPWGGNGWGTRYLIPVLGWWSWNPAGHVWNDVRSRIYDMVYGPELVDEAMAFDDTLIEAKKLFRYAIEGGKMYPLFPARLSNLDDRDRALKLLARMDELQKKIAAKAAEQTMLPEEEMLSKLYILPMAEEVRTGKAVAVAPFPEYWYSEHQRKLLAAVYAGRLDEADQLASSVRERLNRDLDQIKTLLGHMSLTDKYVEFWTHRAAMTAADWQKMMADRKTMLEPHLKEFSYFTYRVDKMTEGMAKPPLHWATGCAEGQVVVRATVSPKDQEYFWGKWQGAILPAKGGDMTCFWMARDGAGTRDDYAEFPLDIPVSGRRDSLHLMFFVSNWNRESLGLENLPSRWATHRMIQILNEDKVLWQEDIGIHRNDGQWYVVDLPKLPDDLKTLKLRLRVEDVRDWALDCTTFVSPIRLLEITH